MKKSLLLVLVLFCIISFVHNKFDVVINEICPNNVKTLKDNSDKYYPWVELYNAGEDKVDLSGYGLSNEDYIPLKWTFPKNTVIKSKKYLIVFLSDETSLEEGDLHTNFEISPKGDFLYLSDPKGELIEKVKIPELKKDISYGRTKDNSFQEMTPTPLEQNKEVEKEEEDKEEEEKDEKEKEEEETKMPIDAPKFSKGSGFYEEEFSLTLTCPEDSEIFYTTDSTDPKNSDTVQKYKKAIKIYDRSSEPNYYAEIGDDENDPTFIGSFGGYKRPKYLIDKAMVVRAYCESEDGISEVIDNTYFVTTGNLEKYSNFTIVSLVVNPEDLFDPDKGIYVVGNEYIEAKKNMNPNDFMAMFGLMYASNFYKEGPEWTKKTNLALFENGKLTLQQNVGIRIRGFSTKMQAGKSFNVYAKKRFGEKSINNTLFKDNYDKQNKLIKKYKSIALRNIFSEERIKDEIANILLYEREFQTIADTRKSILFLNGEYWGFYIILEKFSESYFQSHYNVPKEKVTLIKEGELSNGEETELTLYNTFFNEYAKKNVTDEKVYKEINDFVEIDSLIEHFCIGIYIGTADWPGHNDGVWRCNGEEMENNPYSDGRWRYISFDFDYSMGYSIAMWGAVPTEEPYETNNLKALERNIRPPTNLFLQLLKNNEDFRNRYIARFCDFANGVFNLEKIDFLIDDYLDNYLDMLANSKVRWKGFEFDGELEAFAAAKKDFIKNFDDIRKFYEERPKYALQHLKEFLGLESELQELTITKSGEGKIKINSITPEFTDGKWVGKYFADIPITITAIPSEKSKFKAWSGDVKSEEKTVTFELSKETKIKAEFK